MKLILTILFLFASAFSVLGVAKTILARTLSIASPTGRTKDVAKGRSIQIPHLMQNGINEIIFHPTIKPPFCGAFVG